MFLIGLSVAAAAAGGLLSGCGSAPRPVRRAPSPGSAPQPPSAGSLDEVLFRDPDPRRNEAVLIALSQIGLPYRWGGLHPEGGFDCSGLVVYVFRQSMRLDVPRTATLQAQRTRTINANELRPADLVFFNTMRHPWSHVGIYIGEGRFVHAPSANALVRLETMQAQWWAERFSGARRVLG